MIFLSFETSVKSFSLYSYNYHDTQVTSVRPYDFIKTQKTSVLVGKAATNTVQRCREAIKEDNGKELVMAMRHG